MRRHTLATAVAALLCSALPRTQQEGCGACAGSGLAPCARHDRELEAGLTHCSEVAACGACNGAGVVDCPACEAPDAAAELRRRAERAQAWLARRRAALEGAVRDRGAVLGAADDLELVWSSPRPFRAEGQGLDAHAAMHLYARRLLELRARFRATLELAPADLESPSATRTTTGKGGELGADSAALTVCVLRDADDHRRLTPRLTGLEAHAVGVLRLHGALACCLRLDPRAFADDELLHRRLLHDATLLSLAAVRPAFSLSERGVAWLDAGIAHHFEAELGGGVCTSACHGELSLAPSGTFARGEWGPAVRDLVLAEARPRFQALVAATDQDLDLADRATAFTLVRFVLETRGGRALADLLRAMKAGVASEQAVRDVLGVGPAELDAQLDRFVLERWPKR